MAHAAELGLLAVDGERARANGGRVISNLSTAKGAKVAKEHVRAQSYSK